MITQKQLTEEQYSEFAEDIHKARTSMVNREALVRQVVLTLEHDMEYLCVTGVEDKLQDNVRLTIEKLRQAGIQVWMLTGDKVETAKCIALATGL